MENHQIRILMIKSLMVGRYINGTNLKKDIRREGWSFGEKAKNWIEKIEKEGNCITSSLTLYETLVIVAGLTDKSLKDKEFVKIVVNSIMGLKGFED